ARGALGWLGDPFGDVFGELATKFPRFVEVLAIVSRRTARCARDQDVLQLYRRWQRTRSPSTEARLALLGVRPPQSDRRPQGRGAGGGGAVLRRLQPGIEALSRVEPRLEVGAFLIDEEQRRRAGVRRAPREQLLLRQEDGELAMGLFVDGAALANLGRHDPAR